MLLVIERDVKRFLRYRFLLIMRALWFIVQIALFGLIASRMVVIENYFQYYAAGVSIIILYSTAMFVSYDIYEEAEHGVIDYLLSLPLSRRELVLGRSIASGIRSFMYVGPLMAIVLFLIGVTNPLNLAIALFSLFIFSFGVSGFAITLAVAIKSEDRFDILMGVLDALIVRLSTTLYPKTFIQQANTFYGLTSNFNPLTFASDLFRWGAGIEKYLTFSNPLIPIMAIIIFSSFFALIGIVVYEKRLEGGGWQ